MHTIESLRQIRALEYMFGNGNENNFPPRSLRPFHSHSYKTSKQDDGEVMAVIVLDPRTGEITIEDPLTSYPLQNQYKT